MVTEHYGCLASPLLLFPILHNCILQDPSMERGVNKAALMMTVEQVKPPVPGQGIAAFAGFPSDCWTHLEASPAPNTSSCKAPWNPFPAGE